MCLQIALLGEQHRPVPSTRPASAPAPTTSLIQQAYDAAVIPGAPPGIITSVIPRTQSQSQSPTHDTVSQSQGSTHSQPSVSPLQASGSSQPTVSQELSFNVSGFSVSGLGGSGVFADVYTNPNTPTTGTPDPQDNK